MGSLSDLVSDVFNLEPPLNVDPGNVLLTLKFGAPCDVVRPGRKLRRGKGLPLTMAPQGMFISTADIPIGKRVENVVVAGPYGVRGVNVDVTIAVNQSGDFAALKRYVATKGINFAELLDLEVSNQLDQIVRDTFRPFSAVDLYERGNLTSALAGLTHLLDGLFVIRSTQRVAAEWDTEFIRAREAAAKKARELAEKNLELEHARTIDRELQLAKDQLAIEVAQRRGLTLREWENPELLAQQSAQEHEIRLEVLRQMDSIRRAGGGELVGEALRATSIGGRESPEPPALSHPSWSISTLERDRTLSALWRKSGLPGEPIGLSLSEQNDDTTVVIVSMNALAPEGRATASHIYGERVGASKIVAIDNVSTVEDVVIKYLTTVEPALDDAEPTVRLVQDGLGIKIEIASDRVRLGPLLRRLTDPASESLIPLRDLLDTNSVVLEIASN